VILREEAERLGAEAARVRLGASPCTSEGMLLALALDPLVTVRAAVAMNPAVPHGVVQELASDPDERVRVLLARKVASELPGLSGAEQERLRDQALVALATLVEDEAVRVRAALADVLKDMPEAPRELILRLAHDTAVPVSEPIIRLSPLLDSGDLLALLAAPPHEAAAVAVARRAELPEDVSDAIAAAADTDAVRALLSNPFAQIREGTLDALVVRAALHADWHEPLVRRPVLPNGAAWALSTIVAAHLIEVLAQRADLDPLLAEEMTRRLAARLAPGKSRITGAGASSSPCSSGSQLAANEAAVVAAARRGDAQGTAMLLAIAAGVPVALVDRASTLRSAKGIVSLAWKAGLPMRVAGSLQAVLAQLSPGSMLLPRADGQFPLSAEEMRWHCDFLARSGR